jgi:hypothetical protein
VVTDSTVGLAATAGALVVAEPTPDEGSAGVLIGAAVAAAASVGAELLTDTAPGVASAGVLTGAAAVVATRTTVPADAGVESVAGAVIVCATGVAVATAAAGADWTVAAACETVWTSRGWDVFAPAGVGVPTGSPPPATCATLAREVLTSAAAASSAADTAGRLDITGQPRGQHSACHPQARAAGRALATG